MNQIDKNGVPVLMYHAIVNNKLNPEVNSVHVSSEAFQEQMNWLFDNQYKTISIDEMLFAFEKKQCLQKAVVLTFDDGYKSLLTMATPILKKFNFSATLFLTTAFVGKKSYEEFPNTKESFTNPD